MDTTSCQWFVSPSENTTINPSSIVLLEAGVYLDTTKLKATPENTYNVYYSMKGTGFLSNMGKRIIKTEIEIGNTVVEFPDANLKAAVQTALDAVMGSSGNTLNLVNLMKITVLDASGNTIADLSGLQYCKGLKELDISSNSIPSISLLSSLTELEKFNFQYNSGITDISVLNSMTKLIELKFGGNGYVYYPIGELVAKGVILH